MIFKIPENTEMTKNQQKGTISGQSWMEMNIQIFSTINQLYQNIFLYFNREAEFYNYDARSTFSMNTGFYKKKNIIKKSLQNSSLEEIIKFG